MDLDKMIELAFEAKNNSYSPYSHFRVGCCVRTVDGKYITGCNVENASYGLSICAERTALVKAVSEGHKQISAVVVTADVIEEFISPCGACRQFLVEFGDCDVYMVKPNREWKKSTSYEMLPFGFFPENLKQERTTHK